MMNAQKYMDVMSASLKGFASKQNTTYLVNHKLITQQHRMNIIIILTTTTTQNIICLYKMINECTHITDANMSHLIPRQMRGIHTNYVTHFYRLS